MKILTQTMVVKFLAGLVLCAWLVAPAPAATNTWDADATFDASYGGTGTWNFNSTANWSGAASEVKWTDNTGVDTALFNGTAGTVSISGGVTANGLIFNTAGYTIQSSTLTLAGTTPTISNSVDATISSALAGSAGLVKNGAGKLTLTLGGNLLGYTGNTTVNNGTLTLGGIASVYHDSGATMLISGTGAAVTMSTAGNFGIGVNSSALTTLTVTNNGYFAANDIIVGWNSANAKGAVNMNGGTIAIGSGLSYLGNLGSATWNQTTGTVTFAGQVQVAQSANATITLSGGTFATGGSDFNFNLGNGTAIWNQTGGAASFGGLFTMSSGTGAGTVTVSGGSFSDSTFNLGAWGTGLATLTVTNNGFVSLRALQYGYQVGNGVLNLDGGTLQIGTGNVTWQSSTTGNGTLSFNGGTLLASNTMSIAYNARLHTIVNAGGAFLDSSNFTMTVNSALTNGTGNGGLTKLGSGTLILTGTNTYTGGTTINGGTISVSTIGDSGYSGIGTSGTLAFNSGALRYTNASAATTSRTVTNIGAATIDVNNATGALTLLGVISGAGALTKTGTGTLTLLGANTYTGVTTNSAGRLQLGDGTVGHDGVIASAIIVNNSALTYNLYSNQTYSGNITGTGTLTMSGTGTLELTGNNSYSGLTTVSGGMLKVNNTSGVGITGAVTVSSSTAAVGGSGTISGLLTISGGGHLAPGNSIGTLNVSNLTLNSSVLDFEFNALGTSYDTINVLNSGGFTLNGGGFNIYQDGTLNPFSTPGTYDLIRYVGTLGGSLAPSGLTLSNSPAIANFGTITGTGTLTGYNLLTLTLSAAPSEWIGGNSTDGNTPSNWNPSGVPGANAAVNFGSATANASMILTSVTATIAEMRFRSVVGTTISGTGSFTLNNTNDVATVTVDLGNTHTISTGVGFATNVVITANGGLTIGGAISESGGSRSLTKAGTGTLTLSGVNSYSGGTTLSQGTLVLGGASALGTGNLTISGGALDSSVANLVNAHNNAQSWNGDFTFLGSQNLNLGTGAVAMSASRQVTVTANTLTVGGVISGAAGLTKTGSGTLTLTGANNYTGATTNSAGTLQLGDGTSGHNGVIPSASIVNNGTLAYDVFGSQTYSGVISGSGALYKTGAGTLTLSGSGITYTGNTTVDNGTLSLNFATNVVNVGFAIASGAGATTMLISGNGAVTKTGAGDYFIVGYTGGQGTLTVTNNGYLSVGALRVNWSGAAGGIVNLSGGTISVGSSPTPSAIGSGGTATWNQSGGNANFAGQTIVGWFGGGPTTINLSGGTFTTGAGTFQFGGAGTATWNQTGGNANFGSGGVQMSFGSLPSTMTVSAGTLTETSASFQLSTGTGQATLTVTNTGLVNLGTLQFGAVAGSQAVLNMDGGELRIGSGGVTYGGGTGTLNFNGGTFQAGTNMAIVNNANLHTVVNGGGAVMDSSNFTMTVNSALAAGTGSGGLTKYGSGTLILNGINTYTGSTVVNAGTLIVATSGGLANNGSDKVAVRVGGNTFSSTTPTLIRTVANVDFGSTDYGAQSLGSLGTKADLVDSFTVSRTVTMEWRTANAAIDITPSQFGLVSDVLRLGGLDGTNFVLEMSYNDNRYDGLAGFGGIYLGWRNGSGIWTNAVAGNVGGTAHFAGIEAYNPGLINNLGTWGVDTNANVVWAVLNHNSDFAVLAIPEPGTLFLLGCGALAIWKRRQRRG